MEQQHDKQFDDSFKNMFERFEIEPSEKVWIGISDELDRSRKVKQKTLWAQWAVAASIVLCLFSTAIYFIKKPLLKGEELVSKEDLRVKDSWEKSSPVIIQSPNFQVSKKQSTKTDEIKTTKASEVPKKTKKINEPIKQVEFAPEEEKLAIINPLPSNRVEQLVEQQLNTSLKINKSMLKTAMAQTYNDGLIDDETTPKIDVAAALNYVASKVDKRDKRFLAINKKKGFSLNLGILKVEKKVSDKEEEE